MFTRVAAVIFEDMIQPEIEDPQQQEKQESTGRSNTLISKCIHIYMTTANSGLTGSQTIW